MSVENDNMMRSEKEIASIRTYQSIGRLHVCPASGRVVVAPLSGLFWQGNRASRGCYTLADIVDGRR